MKEKFKSWVINLATGKLLPRVIASASLAVATQVMVLWDKSDGVLPDLAMVLDPADVVNVVTKFATYLLLFGVSKATGQPIRDLMETAKIANRYDGPIDGWAGPVFAPVLKEMINDPEFTVPVKKPTLVPGKVSASGKF